MYKSLVFLNIAGIKKEEAITIYSYWSSSSTDNWFSGCFQLSLCSLSASVVNTRAHTFWFPPTEKITNYLCIMFPLTPSFTSLGWPLHLWNSSFLFHLPEALNFIPAPPFILNERWKMWCTWYTAHILCFLKWAILNFHILPSYSPFPPNLV